MLDGLFVTPAVTAIVEALSSAHAEAGTLAVIGNAKLATALAATKREVMPVAMSARASKKLTNALADLSSVDAGSLAAVVGVDVATLPEVDWEATLREWIRVTRDGGAIVFVDRGHAPEASRRALCAGLTEIEQRHVGRTVITSGLVTHL